MRCTPAHPPVTGMPSTCIGDTVLYMYSKKPNLNLCMGTGVGVWVLLKSPFCVKHPIFTSISWDFDDLSTKIRHAPYNVWSSKHPPAGCTLDGNVIATDQKDTLLLRVASPSPRNNWGPWCVLFSPFFYVWVSFFFHLSRTSFFFSSHVGQVFFFFYVWVKFFFLPLSGSSFFFLQKLPAPPPPWSLMVRPLFKNFW